MSLVVRSPAGSSPSERVIYSPRNTQAANDSRSPLPTGTVTLLLADVVGSTRLWETRPAVMASALLA